jgi:hypothetical protein
MNFVAMSPQATQALAIFIMPFLIESLYSGIIISRAIKKSSYLSWSVQVRVDLENNLSERLISTGNGRNREDCSEEYSVVEIVEKQIYKAMDEDFMPVFCNQSMKAKVFLLSPRDD